jgi:predicted ATP-dependent Lon-type protease
MGNSSSLVPAGLYPARDVQIHFQEIFQYVGLFRHWFITVAGDPGFPRRWPLPASSQTKDVISKPWNVLRTVLARVSSLGFALLA